MQPVLVMARTLWGAAILVGRATAGVLYARAMDEKAKGRRPLAQSAILWLSMIIVPKEERNVKNGSKNEPLQREKVELAQCASPVYMQLKLHAAWREPDGNPKGRKLKISCNVFVILSLVRQNGSAATNRHRPLPLECGSRSACAPRYGLWKIPFSCSFLKQINNNTTSF